MTLFVGLDISVKTTAICIVDDTGKVVAETMVDSSLEVISEQLRLQNESIERVGLEAGPLSQWMYAGLVNAGLLMGLQNYKAGSPRPGPSLRFCPDTLASKPRLPRNNDSKIDLIF